MSGILEINTSFGYALERSAPLLKTGTNEDARELVIWLSQFVLNEYVPAVYALKRFLVSGREEDLLLLKALHAKLH